MHVRVIDHSKSDHGYELDSNNLGEFDKVVTGLIDFEKNDSFVEEKDGKHQEVIEPKDKVALLN